MVTGHGSRDHADARRLAYRDLAGFQQLIDRIVEATVAYLSRQIEAGVHAVPLFDSWSGSLAPAQFEKWVRSEEQTPELQSLTRISHTVLCLQKKNKTLSQQLRYT